VSPLRDVALRNLASRAIELRSKEICVPEIVCTFLQVWTLGVIAAAVEPHSRAFGNGDSQLQPRNLFVSPSSPVELHKPAPFDVLNHAATVTSLMTSRPSSGGKAMNELCRR